MYQYSWSNWTHNSSLSQYDLLFYRCGNVGLRTCVWWTQRPSLRWHKNGYGASVEWYWHGLVKYPDRNFCQCHFVHQESHTDCAGSEARPLWSEVGYTYSRGLVTRGTHSCQMTDPFPNGFIRNLFMHGGVVLDSARCCHCVFVSPLGKLKDTVTALGGIPTAQGRLGDLSIKSSGLFGEIQNCNFACNFNWAWSFVYHTEEEIRWRGRYLGLRTQRNGEDYTMRNFMICTHQTSRGWSNEKLKCEGRVAWMGGGRRIQGSNGETWGKKNHLEDPGVDGRQTLKLILKK
jgi:hypothetical protein